MPELPEVETIKIGLNKLLIGKVIKKVDFDWPKSFPNDESLVRNYLIGSKILSIRRRGKALIMALSSEYSLVIHLKMTGQLVYKDSDVRFGAGHPNDSLIGNLPDKSTRVILSLNNRATLFFNDQRKFGWVRLLPSVEVPNIDFFKKIGPEPLEYDFNWKVLKARMNRRVSSSIKPVLLDQTILAGIGNIYADESLWGAKIHPLTIVGQLTDNKIKQLTQAIKDVLSLSIKLGGSSDRNYINAEGRKGSYLKFAKVFRRPGQPCPRCGHEIIKIRVAGRGTHICPYCQRLRK